VSSSGLNRVLSQEEFAELVGVTQQAVSEMVGAGHLVRDDTGRNWLLAYCKRLRDKAAGRDNDSVLTQERAKLARAQTEAVEFKNAIARGEYAPITVLAEVLASASQAIVDRFEALPGMLRTVAPELPDAARLALETAMVEARNEWVRATAAISAARVEEEDEDEEGDQAAADAPEATA